jgi:DNA-binding CsgD family transcriptional regulator
MSGALELGNRIEFLSRLMGNSIVAFQHNLISELQSRLKCEQTVFLYPYICIVPLDEHIDLSIPEEAAPWGIWTGALEESFDDVAGGTSRSWRSWCQTIAKKYDLPFWTLITIDVCATQSTQSQHQLSILLLRSQSAFNEDEQQSLRIIHGSIQAILDQAVILESLLPLTQGNTPPSPSVIDRNKTYIQARLSQFELTPRQVEVMYLLIQGKELAEIAKEMGCTKATVQKHIENLYRRLGVQSRTSAIAYVLSEIGLL